MIGYLALTAAVAAPANLDATKFAYEFKKDDKRVYAIELTGDMEGQEVLMKGNVTVNILDVKKDGAKAEIVGTDLVFEVDGQEMPAGGNFESVHNLNKYGMPEDVLFEGFEAVVYVAVITTYLPNADLDEGDKFKIKQELGGFDLFGDGKYTGHEKFKDKDYSVLEMKGEGGPPEDEEPAYIEIKSFFDKATGQVFRTESIVEIAGQGELDLTVTLKADD